jgi:hypothetical protein
MAEYTFPDHSGWQFIVNQPQVRARLNQHKRLRGKEVFKGVWSDDLKFLKMTRRWGESWTSRFSATSHDNLAGTNGVTGEFYRIQTVAGYPMTPRSIPLMNNRKLRADLGLVEKPVSSRHEAIFEGLLRLMMRGHVPTAVSIRKAAVGGVPDFIKAMDEKKKRLSTALLDGDTYLKLVAGSDHREEFNAFNSINCHSIGSRQQADSITKTEAGYEFKARFVNDEEAARSGLERGQRVPVDKTVIVNGQKVVTHSTTRNRNVWAAAFVPNYFAAAWFAGAREYYLTMYDFTWKHRTRAELADKMAQYKYHIGVDVSEFDTTLGEYFADMFCDVVGHYSDERFAALLKRKFRAPYVMAHPYGFDGLPGNTFNPCFGSVFGDNPDLFLGLPSGIAPNPDVGKWFATAVYLCILDDFYHDVVEDMPNYLKGRKRNAAVLDMSDDGVFMTNDPDFQDFVIAGLSREDASVKDAFSYMKVAVEDPLSFLGNVPTSGTAGLVLLPNILNAVTNLLVPEHGIESSGRMNTWAIGMQAWKEAASHSPIFAEIWDDIQRGLFDEYNYAVAHDLRATSRIQEMRLLSEAQRVTGASVSPIDALVLMNPDVVHYRVSRSDVSAAVLNTIESTLPLTITEPFIRSIKRNVDVLDLEDLK